MGKKIIFILCFACCLFVSCTSTVKRTDNKILDYQREIDRLENELSNRDRAIENAVRRLDTVTERSQSMEGTVDELIELFDEYQRGIEQLLYDYYKAEFGAEDKVTDNKCTTSYIDTKNGWNDCRLYYLCKRNQAATVAGYTALRGGPYDIHSKKRYLV